MISNSTIIVLNILSLMAMLMSALPSYNNTDMAYYNAYAVQRQLSSSLKGSHEKDEKRLLNSLTPLKNEANIMFWRPQKVGSSTMLSLLISYGFRYLDILMCFLKYETVCFSNHVFTYPSQIQYVYKKKV